MIIIENVSHWNLMKHINPQPKALQSIPAHLKRALTVTVADLTVEKMGKKQSANSSCQYFKLSIHMRVCFKTSAVWVSSNTEAGRGSKLIFGDFRKLFLVWINFPLHCQSKLCIWTLTGRTKQWVSPEKLFLVPRESLSQTNHIKI